jgi:hypothetical protein
MNRRMQVALALAAAGLVGGGGVAVAQSRGDDPAGEREAFLADAADRLGVEPGELESALEEAAVAGWRRPSSPAASARSGRRN